MKVESKDSELMQLRASIEMIEITQQSLLQNVKS